ncbi:MAG: isocitrate/isopropylmalate dehydrogenase family protein [Candidatus Aminicenantes bacterium]|nr:isocitrate/isopropylmalate dehydrogenase family protein [Candidatus Aminicenantes bacterium]NIM82847.1 isocitrate/isopropylmalate dehydrogenase family protein [Candidatus Aminicenantes bacterium]NIN22223.1 isocitrate/isopropylmalate dehydrogenase family protein [Candidatus Aminicenantes bacterium]NIN45991.1 isocitrate/isopropylmalate dehydrogenase family protein [Candidatus Aminicenantes bacterium]NIN88827.1 isocitrate/isopropylmalate dehydrogenase family protein [Candidatus Aminicenantes ba
MSKRTIVTMPGDGIGKIVLAEALRVLEAAGFQADYVHADIGWEFWCNEGNPLPQRTLDLLEKHKIGLFGAITSKPKAEAARELAPKLQDKGYVYYSPIVGLRQHFNLDICMRPCKTFKGNPLNFIRRGKNNEIEEPEVDVVIFRQNTEGLYAGVEWTNPPDNVYQALASHPKFKKFADTPKEELAVSTRILTKKATQRIVRAAFEHAKKFGYKSVTVCEKPNVIRETSGMMLAIGREIAKEYEGIELWNTNIDAQMMWLTKNPEDYSVIVSSNMFGDIVSDGFAGLVGGLGFACSANIGEEVAIFEPTHGSAPKYETYDPPIVNPIAMILSACLMLDHIGETEKAQKIRAAIAKVVKEGKVRTYDMMKLKGSPEALQQGAASTTEITDEIISKIKS